MPDALVKRSSTRTRIGVEVDDLRVVLMCTPEVLIGNVPCALFALSGGFDGARLQLTREYAESWTANVAGNLPIFEGRVSDVEVVATEVRLTVRSDLELLNILMPRNIFMAQCTHTLYDQGCTLDRGDFTANHTVTANTSSRFTFNTSITDANGYYDLGTMEFTSGALAGVKRTIKSQANTGVVSVMPPLPSSPVSGDGFSIVPGCDKLLATCKSKFGNSDNFRGFPFIPVPETAL